MIDTRLKIPTNLPYIGRHDPVDYRANYETIEYNRGTYTYKFVYEDERIVDFELYVKTYVDSSFKALFYITKTCKVWFNDIKCFKYKNKNISLNELIFYLCEIVKNQ